MPCEPSQAHVILDNAKPMDLLRSSPRRQAVARVRGLVAPSARFFRVFSVARSCSYIAFTSKFSLECRRRRGLVSSPCRLCSVAVLVLCDALSLPRLHQGSSVRKREMAQVAGSVAPPRPRWVGEVLRWRMTRQPANQLAASGRLITPLPAGLVLRPPLGTHKYALAPCLRVLRPRSPRHRIPSLPYTPYLLAPGLTHHGY